MGEDEIGRLNDRHGVPGRVRFVAGPGGAPVAELRGPHGAGSVALHGAQPLSFQPAGAGPVLWLSRHAVFAEGKAIRGGIPVCWPWFGPHPDDPGKPAHGFVRTARWDVVDAGAAPGGAASIRLALRDSEATRALWPHAFELRLSVVLGPRLRVELEALNTGSAPFTCGGALHSYFAVGDIGAVAVRGLEGAAYLDQVDGRRVVRQEGPVTFTAETDRVYLDTEAACTIEDSALGRRIGVAKSGSRTTVVWNPWVEKARRLADFGDDEYRAMVCVETANADGDAVTLAPGASHRLALDIGLS